MNVNPPFNPTKAFWAAMIVFAVLIIIGTITKVRLLLALADILMAITLLVTLVVMVYAAVKKWGE